MFKSVCILAIGSMVLAGCAGSLPGLRPLTYATPGEARLYVLGSECPHTKPGDEVAGLIAAAIGQAAGQILKNFGQALKDGSQGGALSQVTASQNIQLLPGQYPKCVVLVRGTFADLGAAGGQDITALLKDLDDNSRTKIADLGVPKLTSLDYYAELKLSGSSSEQALKFEPIYLLVARSIDGDRKGSRDVSISLKVAKPGVQDPIGSAVVLGGQQIGKGWTYNLRDRRFGVESPWFAAFNAVTPSVTGTATPATNLPGATVTPLQMANGKTKPKFGSSTDGLSGTGLPSSSGQNTATTSNTKPPEAPVSGIVEMNSTDKHSVPLTVIATVVETRPTKEGLAFIAAIFNGVEPQVESAVKPLYDSSASTQLATADLTLQASLADAEGKARSSIITYCTASSADPSNAGRQDRIAKSADARSAQIKANSAALSASKPLIFSSVVTISGELPSVANAGPCGS